MHTVKGSLSPVIDRFRLDAALRGRSWEWLVALRDRLQVAVQLVDPSFGTVLPDGDSPVGAALGRALAANAPPIRLAISNAMQSKTRHAVIVDRLEIHGVPITSGRAVVGTLVVARPQSAALERKQSELEVIGATLATAVEAHLAGAPANDRDDLEQVGAFARLLSEQAEARTDRDVLAAFADALAVWHDIELRGYVEAADGDYVLTLTLPGAERDRAEPRLPSSIAPADGSVELLSHSDPDASGALAGAGAVAKLGTGRGSWLLILSGAMDSRVVMRLGVYLGMLAPWIAATTALAAQQLIGEMTARLMSGSDGPEAAATEALTALHDELQNAAVLLNISTASGAPLLRVELPARASAGSDELVVVHRNPQRHTIMLAVAAPHARLTLQHRLLVERASRLFVTWSGAGLQRPTRSAERRSRARSADDIFERFARQAVERGTPVSAVILGAPHAVFHPGLTQAWVARIRGSMRASDIVGMLGEGELAVLLHDATREQAALVADRICRLVTESDAQRATELSVGIASRTPGTTTSHAIVQEARASAVLLPHGRMSLPSPQTNPPR